ncbi:MAG: DEAD/DEAH box helicase family protein [Gemmatimonadota bacterium]|nr:DEAD/DEAH box helicase family protein [Gemmatimonadota bacterium]
MAQRARNRPQVPFSRKLVLNQWLLSLFEVSTFRELADTLKREDLEGLDENNIHHFHHVLAAQFPNLERLPTQMLLEYDQNIVRHTQQLNEERITSGEAPIVWKYFQYLGLLFCEIYLDRYFNDPEALLNELNKQMLACNTQLPTTDQVALFDEDAEAWPQLNKLAFWMATGSGKTLIMHVNSRQYRHYLGKHGKRGNPNRILLLTPNEGLSKQHIEEFKKANIDAKIFDKRAPGLYGRMPIEILEVTRLRDEMGEKTVAVEAFEGNNLVLIDEGHRGASSGKGGTWMRHRDALCEQGFSFEYSATFGQAIKGNRDLTETYAKSTLYDYSYRYFYKDGFGKDYQIFNIDHDTQENHLELYLVACLLSFFQQRNLYQERKVDFRPFNIEQPLWVFVGGRVVKSWSEKDASDIVRILLFLDGYVTDRAGSIQRIDEVLNRGIRTASGTNLLEGRFMHLIESGLSPEQIFNESLALIFNAPAGGRLYVENLKGVTGEVALRLGAENEAFGVINVGEPAKLVKLCEEHELAAGEREFSVSLFSEINEEESTINLLIGSRKFTEGWSSWRVSTMGLMNIGRTEGAQIIQLFGRGVRLKGYNTSLKRSSAGLPNGIQSPRHIGMLETLGIFGIKADYMAQFREFLIEEGLPTDNGRLEFLLPTIKNLGKQKLKTIRLKKTINGVQTDFGEAFRRLGPIPTLAPPDTAADASTRYLQKNPIVINWYPKIEAMKSSGIKGRESSGELNEAQFGEHHIAFLDMQRLYFELERFKAERGWHNLNISQRDLGKLLTDPSWYCLQIPEYELIADSYNKVQRWEEIALALLKKYTERYYTFRKRQWEEPHLEYRELESNDSNFPDAYRILIDRSQEEIEYRLKELGNVIRDGDLSPWEFQGIHAVQFSQHLYQPLLYLNRQDVQISPVPLNDGERQFVEDLKVFYDNQSEFFDARELYLIRNLSRGRGVGFFEAGNFHPDFILWLLNGNQQTVIFVDPKGIRHLGFNDPKILFYRTIKEIEKRLGDPDVRLESYIVSNTPSLEMHQLWDVDKQQMEERHVLFQKEDKDTYVQSMLVG